MSSQIRFEIQGLNCAACAARAETALASVEGVAQAAVSIADHAGRVSLAGAQAEDLRDALKTAGYPAREEVLELQLDGLSCAGCAGRVEKALAALPGVLDPGVNFADSSARVSVLAGAVSMPDAIKAVRAAGYDASAVSDDPPDSPRLDAEMLSARQQAMIAVVLALPVFILEMGGHMVPAFHHWVSGTIGHQTSWLVQFLLTTLVLAWPGRVFLQRGLPNLLRGHPDMNSLVLLGAGAAWLYSSVVLFLPDVIPASARAVYFEAAAVIVALILVGRWLEARARGQAGAAIRALAGLQPDTALVEQADGTPTLRPIAQIKVGDLVQLRPGERVAVDGIVETGQSRLDESMITGEPGTVLRGPGDAVTAGTVNGSGGLTYRAQRVGSDTVLARIINMVRDAQGAKLPVQSLADRVIARFVPAVLGLALLTLLVWLWVGPEPKLSHALVAAVSVLIIACPCAMGLATPTSIMAGTGRAAQLGVLFRKGEALQRLEEARVVAFDKTGTLTLGQPRVVNIVCQEPKDEDALLRLIGAAEARSEHPIAEALVKAARDRALDLPQAEDVLALEGMGLSAVVEGKRVLIGSPRLMKDRKVDITALEAAIEAAETRGQSIVLAAVEGQAKAVLAVADTLKPEAISTLRALQARGLRTAMITGDSSRAAQAIGAQLGLSDIRAEVLPGGKKDAVEALRAEHGPVVFVGDGINDAPALAAADVGIAMGTGTDVAIESAEVVLTGGRLPGVLSALDLSRSTMRNIRQNLFWAFGYNVTLIPVAAGLLYPLTGLMLSPMLAAGAMALSSVFVVSNALRLRRFAPDPALETTAPSGQPVAAE